MTEEIVYQDRRNTNCEKWDGLLNKFGNEEMLPLWVADMDFQVPKCVRKALEEYAKKGVFGYYKVPESFCEAFIRWGGSKTQLSCGKGMDSICTGSSAGAFLACAMFYGRKRRSNDFHSGISAVFSLY